MQRPKKQDSFWPQMHAEEADMIKHDKEKDGNEYFFFAANYHEWTRIEGIRI